MGIKGEDDGNQDLKLFDRANFEVAEYDQWNVGVIDKTGQVVLGFRRRIFMTSFKTIGYFMKPEQMINMGEKMIACGVAALSKRDDILAKNNGAKIDD